MLKETRLDTASPTGVEGLSLRVNRGCEGHGYVGGIKREAPALARESAKSLPGREE